MTVNLNIVEKCVSCLNIKESYDLARHMEQEKTNPVLGYRTAGSLAERKTGDMLLEEMKKAGLTQVEKDKIRVDAWKFKKAVMRCHDREGTCREIQLGAYQTDFKTNGFQRFDLVYLGKGTADEYKDIDVKGKLVLIEINQREEWWINFPVYQAHLKGAAALIAVQDQGYGEIHDTSLNAQDIAGPKEAAAFSISQADAAILKEDMGNMEKTGNYTGDFKEIQVLFDAQSTVIRDRESYNITGMIPGEEPEQMIMLSAHYDSYFTGFQDDNAAVAMMLGIARTFIDMGYKPRKTLVFCAMAAEEWGVVDSKYDWSTGAYEQVFTAHPEWQGKVIADFNFELPAHAHGKKDAVRCTYEYASFMKKATEHIQPSKEAYPEGLEVHFPIQTWSDDFSIAIAGIPSSVNEFSDGEFMETHYHSQFDNEDFYDEPVYRFHHNLYGKLVLAFDHTAVVPMDFERLFAAVEDSVDRKLCEKTEANETVLLERLKKAKELGRQLYDQIQKINETYKNLLEAGKYEEAKAMAAEYAALNSSLLYIFRKEQDYFVRLNWHDDVLFPQQGVGENLKAIYKALGCLKEDDPEGALEAVYEIDNNRYAFLFDREVFRYFTEYVLNQPADRLKWGYGRIIHHENLYDLVVSLKEKNKLQKAGERPDQEEEYKILLQAANAQEQCYRDDIDYMASSVEKLLAAMEGCVQKQ
mgnify:FL=1